MEIGPAARGIRGPRQPRRRPRKLLGNAGAPAGAALVYDSRIWHRRCDELNTSGRDRMAILNAFAQSWVPPMWEKESIGRLYKRSDVPDMLTKRQRRDIDRLCNREAQPRPEGMPILLERQKI